MARRDLPTPDPPAALATIDGLAYSHWLPQGAPRGGVIVIPGADSRKENHHDMARTARSLGWAAVAYDQRGHGASEGDLDDRILDDVRTIATLLPRPLVLRGSSMGGTVALLAAGGLDADAVIAICPAPVDQLLRGLRAGRFGFRADRERLEPFLAQHDLGSAIEAYRGAVILLHAEGDERVEVAGTVALHDRASAARARKLIVVAGGDHRSVQHDAELQGLAMRWVARALGLPAR